jgi:NTP pyrophosphatase (non-canonical NTP hydrolase)
MKTFSEYQTLTNKVPVSLRSNRQRIELPVLGLQQEAGKIGSLLSAASISGTSSLTPEQRREAQDRLADLLWYVALLCKESGITMQDVAKHSITQLQARSQKLDPDRR